MNSVIFTLILGTATPGGGFPVYGDAFAAMLNAQEPQIRIETRNTKGSTENVPLLEAGKLDLGLVAGELASAALARPGTELRIVAAMYSSPGMFKVRADSPVRRIADLKGKPVVLGTQGSGITVLGRAAALWGAGVGWPAFSTLAKSAARFVAPDADEVKRILARALHRAESPFAARLEQARESTAANIVAASPRADLIHPGVRRYLREAGLLGAK